ncbi:hypothetical protein [Variovorax paradoxus]|uniref:hypothetical protein n=1 Tax=Variovorax paradoxus TaxID=34073 RepID=UPI001ABC8BDC
MLFAWVIANHAIASMPLSIPLRELYGISSVVAVVEVVEGRTVAAGGESCGARYKGRVIEGMKNATAGQLIEFGYVPSLKIGSRYFVLLDDYKNVPLDRLADFHSRCESVLPGLALVGIWRGVMEVTSNVDEPMRRDAWTVRRSNHVEYPIGTRGKMVDGERQLVFTDMVARMKQGSPTSR